MINSFASRLLRVTTVNEAAWAVAKHTVGRLGYVDCIVYLVNDEGELFQSAAHGNKNPTAFDIEKPIILKFGEGICGHVALTKIGEVIRDTSQDSRYAVDDEARLSEITVPILSDGEVIGIIDSEHPEKNYFSDQDLEILNTIASLVSVKIAQTKAVEELAQHKADLEKRVTEKTHELQQTIKMLQDSNNQIQKSNIEKETLLREIHHRVKNNLQIVSSLLNLHANRIGDHKEVEIFVDCQNRIKAMSIIHEQLYNKKNLSEIDTKKYINEICQELLIAYDPDSDIKLNLDLETLYLDIETSIPFGLILNELLVNSMKHAFLEEKGDLRIQLRQLSGKVQLIVSDNGVGFDLSKELDTMGIDLINTLASQINGSVSFTSSDLGTKCTIIFPSVQS